MNSITAIIRNYNTKDLLIKCVKNLVDLKLDMQVIIIDGGSTDGSAEEADAVFSGNSSVTIVRGANTGISKGYNQGYEMSTGKYIFYLGTDTFPKREMLLALIEYYQKPENYNVGIITTKLITANGSIDRDAHRGELTPWSGFTHFSGLEKVFPKTKLFGQYFMTYENMDKPHEIYSCISHFMFVKREAHEKVGLWDEQFFVYGEDIDFCYRMRLAGYKIMYLPQWETIHLKGAGMGRKTTGSLTNASRNSKFTKYILSRESTNAMRKYYKKHLIHKYPMILNILVLSTITALEFIRSSTIKLKDLVRV